MSIILRNWSGKDAAGKGQSCDVGEQHVAEGEIGDGAMEGRGAIVFILCMGGLFRARNFVVLIIMSYSSSIRPRRSFLNRQF